MRAYAVESSTKRAVTEKLNTDSPYYRLLTKESSIKVDFTEHPEWESEARRNKLIRFLGNPHARWGPLGKAVAKKKRTTEEESSVQNKRQVRNSLHFATRIIIVYFVLIKYFRLHQTMSHQLLRTISDMYSGKICIAA